jgi:transposase
MRFVMARSTLEQRVFMYGTCVKCGSARKCRREFRRKFLDEEVLSRQTVHNVVNTLRITGLLIDKKQKHKRRVLTEEKLDDIGTRPRKSLEHLAQGTGVSKSSARRATKLLKLRPYKTTTTIHARLAAARSSQQGQLLQLLPTVSRRR